MRVRIVLRLALGVVLAGVLLAALAVPLFLTPGIAPTWSPSSTAVTAHR
jgi:hypothetical protein